MLVVVIWIIRKGGSRRKVVEGWRMGKRADATRVASDRLGERWWCRGCCWYWYWYWVLVLVVVVVVVWVASLHKFRKYRVENRYPHRDYRWWLVGAA
ncbi:hypothetical protein M0804_000379 [Polistes exclamans]|nr:hypothetical protein M0804_000379 [Polistes exclamans]